MKITDILKSASSNLWRNKGRTILTIIAIFIGAFTITLTTGVNIGVNDYIDKQIGSVGGEDQLMVSPGADSLGVSVGGGDEPTEYDADKGSATEAEALTQKDLDKIKGIDGIKSVKPFLMLSPDYIEGESGKKYEFSVASSSDITIDLEEGKEVSTTGDAYEVNLAPEFVKSLGYSSAKDALNKKVKIAVTSQATGEQEVVDATIVGVRNVSLVQNGQSIISNGLANKIVEISEKGLPENMKDMYYMAFATMEKGYVGKTDKINKLKERLSDQDYSAMTVEDEIGMIRQVVNAITGVLTVFGAIALLAASFGIVNTLYMSVQDRTREIGLMKAMGMGSGKIFLSFSVEALLIGFWGSVLGILGAMGAGALLNEYALKSFLEGMTGFTLLQFSIPSMIVIVLVIMLIAFLAGTLPARRAAKLDPIESLRYE